MGAVDTRSDVEPVAARISTGISGLDEILDGGLLAGRAYLVRGGPGCGKTTLGLHFLTCGSANGEPALFITLAEPEAQLRANAERASFDLAGVTFLDLSPDVNFFSEAQSYDIFSPSEVEREPITRKIIERLDQLKPRRVFIDSMTQFRYLAVDAFQFRKQALSFLRFLATREATVLLTSEGTSEAPDDDLRFMSDGVIELDSTRDGRAVRVHKFRGSDFRTGPHTIRIGERGLTVFPRLQPESYGRASPGATSPSGIVALDRMLAGGLERGTVTLITGPTGVGKTTLGLVFMKAAAERGERSVVYTFEENPEILLHRCEAMDIPVRAMMERGTLSVISVEPLQFTPDEFASMVRFQVEDLNSRMVMVDSASGYRLSLRGEDPARYLHALCKYLANMSVTTLLINEVEAITGDFRATEIGISYIADNIIFLRYVEIDGALHKAIGVLKKRLSDFEKSIHSIKLTARGVEVGEPLRLQGLLQGTAESGAAR
jgi:circadian clock protein KaiC